MEFYKYLKACREKKNITQEQLVSALYEFDPKTFENLDTGTLSRWERNTTRPKFVKQVSIVRYFQQSFNDALPCWEGYSEEEVEHLICTTGVQNIFGKPAQLILNFPAESMEFDSLTVYPIRDIDTLDTLFELNMDLHTATNPPLLRVSLEQFKKWSVNPCSFFLACEYKEWFLGYFFSIKLKQEIFEKIMNFEMKKSEITEDDFAAADEPGSNYLLSFYALNNKVASILFIRYYAYLIANQKYIAEIGVSTALEEVKKVVRNMNLDYYKTITIEDRREVDSYRQNLGKILSSEYVVKMIFSDPES